jgi:hypothetical protein
VNTRTVIRLIGFKIRGERRIPIKTQLGFLTERRFDAAVIARQFIVAVQMPFYIVP